MPISREAQLAEFDRAMRGVVEMPRRYPLVRAPDIRRARLDRFPFHVLFRDKQSAVQVLAVAHVRRRPGYWLGR